MSTRENTNSDRALSATPAVERLLATLSRRLTLSILVHGFGTVLFAAVAWLAFAFFADYALHVPHPVRLAHLAIAIALPLFVAWRYLVRPLSRRPDRSGLAMLVERAEPGLGELLVSAVELQQNPAPSGNPERIQEVLAAAEARASALSAKRALDPFSPLRRGSVGALAVVVALVAMFVEPEYANIFFTRLFGGALGWPQRTHLAISIPSGHEHTKIDVDATEIRVRVARGSDLAVMIEAHGTVPEEVTLHLTNGDEIALAPGGDSAFRTVLRSAQEDFGFYASGGDDPTGDRKVTVKVLEPPDVGALAVTIQPPEYTGLEARVERDRDVQVPAGSKLSIAILPHPKSAVGSVRILPEDRALDLVATPFPRENAKPDEAPEQGLGFELTAEHSLRYRFQLTDPSGLENPDPGLFAIEVVEDRPPELEVLIPGRSEVETVRGGALRLLVRASDDFGVRTLAYRATRASVQNDEGVTAELAFQPIAAQEADASSRHAVISSTRIELSALVPAGTEVGDGEQLTLALTAHDNRPDPAGASDDKRIGRAAPVRIRVVTEEEFLRRAQDRLARLRIQVGELEELARAKEKRVRELIAGLESDAPGAASSSTELAAALSGARRVQVDAEAASRELASILEGILYARVDQQAAALFEQLDEKLSHVKDREFPVASWRELAAAQREGRVGSTAGLAAQLVAILDVALEISHVDEAKAAAALERAAQAIDQTDVHQRLLESADAQTLGLTHIDDLLSRLAEWDNFQSILSLARDILNRQKTLLERTRSSANQK